MLTYNRREVLGALLAELGPLTAGGCEILVVDNASSDGTAAWLEAAWPQVRTFPLDRNIGAEARNVGIRNARGPVVITLDDDIFGITEESVRAVLEAFRATPRLAALCFKVLDHHTGGICNWCHPCAEETHADRHFLTTEITEGAVAFRREAVVAAGMYPARFFISHEGSDLAARLLDRGHEIAYSPDIAVTHRYAAGGRASWRRYYYDTRNAFWLAVRNYRWGYGARFVAKRTAVMLVYSLRDGYFPTWLKAVGVSLRELPEMLESRHPVSRETERKIRRRDRNRPGVLYYIRKRLRQKQVRI